MYQHEPSATTNGPNHSLAGPGVFPIAPVAEEVEMAVRAHGCLKGLECKSVPFIEFRRGNVDESQHLVHRVVGLRGLDITIHHVLKEAVGAAAYRVQATRVPNRDRTVVRDLMGEKLTPRPRDRRAAT
jgi:hypothetical protein